jgi:hypothetical protein
MAMVPLVAAAAMMPSMVRADGMTLHVSPGTLHARVEITFTLTIDCPAPAPGDYVSQEAWAVSVEEAAGWKIAYGEVEMLSQYPSPMFFQCTGSAVTLPIDILAQTPGPAFRRGQAIVTASAGVAYASGASVSASVGPAVVRLHW